MKVHNCENKQFIFLFIIMVHNAIRKPTNKATTNIAFDKRPHLWMSGRSLYCCKHFNGELIAKHFLAIFVIIYCQLQLRLSLRVKGVRSIASAKSFPDFIKDFFAGYRLNSSCLDLMKSLPG